MLDVIFDASGKRGSDGKDGEDGGCGTNGGNIDLELSSVKQSVEPGQIHIRGTITYHDNRVENIDQDYLLGNKGTIHVKALGGNGGNGGRNVNSGRRGGKGGNAGNGGHIRITTSEHDVHLLMLIEYDAEGGICGKSEGYGTDGNNGNNGKDGHIEFGIINEHGQWEKRNDENFLLEISDLTYECEIIEPDSTFCITNFKFKNIGKDPTPKFTDIRIELASNKWIKGNSVNAPIFIQPNTYKSLQEENSEQKMHLSVNNLETIIDEEPFNRQIELEFKAIITKIERPISLSSKKNFLINVEYPVNISEIVATCEEYDIYALFWAVNNTGKTSLGQKSISKRQIRTILVESETKKVIDDQEIQLIEGGKSIQVVSQVKLNNGNNLKNLILTLQIGSVDEPNNLKSIQRRRFKIQPISRYSEINNVNDPVYMSEIVAIRAQSQPEYDVYVLFWSVNNVGKFSLGQQSDSKRQVKTTLINDETNEVIDQEIQLMESGKSTQVTSRVKLKSNNNNWCKFTVTLRIGFKSVQRRRFKIRPRSGINRYLVLDASNNACENVDSYKKNNIYKGSINIFLSYQFDLKTNLRKVLLKGSMKFCNGLEISLNDSFYFETNDYIFITNKENLQECDAIITTEEHERYLFSLVKNTYEDYEDENSKISWKFQTINPTNNTVNEYLRPFKLEVIEFELYANDNIEIYEPTDEIINVRNLRICNHEKMPTPNNNILITISSDRNIFSNDALLLSIANSIEFNEIIEFKDLSVKFSILENDIKKRTNPLQIKDRIKLNAVINSSISHTIQNFCNINKELIIQYPIKIDEFVGFRNPSETEEVYDIFWKIKNVSNVEFGKNSKLGRRIESSLYNDDDVTLHTSEIDLLEKKSDLLLKSKIKFEDKRINEISRQFILKLSLSSTESSKTLLPIQSHSFHLKHLQHEQIYKNLDLVFDLGASRLTLNDEQPNDYIKPGSFQIKISSPKSNNVKIGDIVIQGILQYTNGWNINLNDHFSLGTTGLIYLYPNGKIDLSGGTINIEIAQEETHLLYLIEQTCLDACRNLLYKVINNSTTTTSQEQLYNRMYQITLVNYGLELEDENGIYEPEAIINVRNIKVRNTGGMPTPTNRDVEISINLLESTGIHLINENRLYLPKPIEPTQEVILSNNEKCLEFQIARQEIPSVDKHLNLCNIIQLRATMLGINREITSFNISKKINVCYPVQIRTEIVNEVIPYKNITRISWDIRNISNIDLGSDSISQRVIKIQVIINEMDANDDLKFQTKKGLSTYFEQEISLLGARQSKKMYCDLTRTLSNQNLTIMEANISILLYLGTIKSPHEVVNIEVRKLYVEISPLYEPNINADLLLVTNSRNVKKDITSWNYLCQELGLTMSLWDINRECHFDLFKPFNIVQDFQGKVIVILEDEESIINIVDLIDPDQFYQAINDYNIKFYIVGTNINDQKIKSLFIPRNMIKSAKRVPMKNKLLFTTTSKVGKIGNYLPRQKSDGRKSKLMQFKNIFEQNQKVEIEDIQNYLQKVNMNSIAVYNFVKENTLQNLSKTLKKTYPQCRYIFIINNQEIILSKTVDRTQRYMTCYNFQKDRNVDYINSRTNKIGLLSSISFSSCLDRLLKMMYNRNKIHNLELLEILKDLIEVDLSMELFELCKKGEVSNEISPDTLITQLKFFQKFSMEFVVDIIAKENSISSTNTDWILDVLAKLNALISFLKLKKVYKNFQKECQKVFSFVSEHAKNLNVKLLEDSLNYKVTLTLKRWSQECTFRQINDNELEYYVKSKILECLNEEGKLKTDWEFLDNNEDIILTREEYDNFDNYHVKTNTIINKTKTAYKMKIKSVEKHAGAVAEDIIFNHGVENIMKVSSKAESSKNNAGSEVINRHKGMKELPELPNNAGSEVINRPSKEFGSEVINLP